MKSGVKGRLKSSKGKRRQERINQNPSLIFVVSPFVLFFKWLF